MNMKFSKTLFFTSWMLLAMVGCESEDTLPAPTSEGRNTFGCKINGKAWVPNGVSNEHGPSAKAIEVEFTKLSDSTFYLLIHTNASTRDRVQISLTKGVIGKNVLRNRHDDPFGIYYDSQFRIFNSMESKPGQVVITRLDTLNRIVSGTFEFDGQYVVNKEIVRITDGRFDLDMDDL